MHGGCQFAMRRQVAAVTGEEQPQLEEHTRGSSGEQLEVGAQLERYRAAVDKERQLLAAAWQLCQQCSQSLCGPLARWLGPSFQEGMQCLASPVGVAGGVLDRAACCTVQDAHELQRHSHMCYVAAVGAFVL